MKIYDFYKVISTCVLWGTGEKMAGILAEIDLWKLEAEIHRFPRIIILNSFSTDCYSGIVCDIFI